MVVETKICGLTRPEDAAAAAAAGAAYLGVVFAGGPRRVDAARARSIVAAAGAVPVFAVFGGQPVRAILALRDRARFQGVQLHGDYDADDARMIASEGLTVWRVLHLAGAADLERVAASAEAADAVLVEPRVPGIAGGSGVALAPTLALAARERLTGRRMVLAGGLEPGNVREAVALVRPDVVDVSSGVELSAGIKDAARIARFLEALA